MIRINDGMIRDDLKFLSTIGRKLTKDEKAHLIEMIKSLWTMSKLFQQGYDNMESLKRIINDSPSIPPEMEIWPTVPDVKLDSLPKSKKKVPKKYRTGLIQKPGQFLV